MKEYKTTKDIGICASDIMKADDEELGIVRGGSEWNALVWRRRHERETKPHMKANYAGEYCREVGMKAMDENKYPCPVCGSMRVSNYDPGILRLMRVICRDCGAFKCRDGSDPWL